MTVIGSRLWMMSLQACALIVVVLIARFFLKKYPKIISYSLWILVGVRLLCPAWVESPFSIQPDYGTFSDIMQEDGTNEGSKGDILQNVEVQENETAGIVQNMVPGVLQPEPLNVRGLLIIIYLAGIVVVSCFYLVQYFLMRHRVSTAVKAKGNVWFCEDIQSPFVMGVFHSKIIIPYGLSEKERYHVLKHERVHIRHHDPLIRLIGLLCICLHWWNPLVWLAVHKMNQDMEMFCDEAALRNASAEEKKSYARTLLAFAERQSGFSVELAFGESNTEKRVKNIMRKRKSNIVIVSLVALLALFCVIALLTVPGRNDNGGNSFDTPENDAVGEEESSTQDETEETPVQPIEEMSILDQALESGIYGEWTVTEYIPPTGYHALSTEEMQSYVGSSIIYDESSLQISEGEAQPIEGYLSRVMTAREFEEYFGVSTGELELANTAFVCYEVKGTLDSAFGAFFYQIDSENALIHSDGVFFRVTRTYRENVIEN